MIITLTDDEVRAALAKAIEEKTSFIFGTINHDECFFTVEDTSGDEMQDVGVVTFTASVDVEAALARKEPPQP